MRYDYLIIFGAAVTPEGKPSGSLRRRIEGAWQAAKSLASPKFILTGGQGKHGPTEASVMAAALLELGANEKDLILEEQSTDTLQSIYHTAEILKHGTDKPASVTVCSSNYHNYRCQILYRLVDIKSVRAEMPSDRPALGTPKWLYYYLRETIATPWDIFLMLLGRIRK